MNMRMILLGVAAASQLFSWLSFLVVFFAQKSSAPSLPNV
jgi:hypothetical protein